MPYLGGCRISEVSYLRGSRSTICIGKSIGRMGLCRISEVPLWEVCLYLFIYEQSIIIICPKPGHHLIYVFACG